MKSKVDTLVREKPVATVTYQERLWRLFNRFGPAIMLMAVVAGMSIAHPDFLTISNLMTIGLQAAVRALLDGDHQRRDRSVGRHGHVPVDGDDGSLRD